MRCSSAAGVPIERGGSKWAVRGVAEPAETSPPQAAATIMSELREHHPAIRCIDPDSRYAVRRLPGRRIAPADFRSVGSTAAILQLSPGVRQRPGLGIAPPGKSAGLCCTPPCRAPAAPSFTRCRSYRCTVGPVTASTAFSRQEQRFSRGPFEAYGRTQPRQIGAHSGGR